MCMTETTPTLHLNHPKCIVDVHKIANVYKQFAISVTPTGMFIGQQIQSSTSDVFTTSVYTEVRIKR